MFFVSLLLSLKKLSLWEKAPIVVLHLEETFNKLNKKRMRRELFDYNNEKHLIISLEGTTLITETGKLGKLRTTKKEFPTLDEAILAFGKKHWEGLKKGFVYHNPNAQKGEAILHKFLSRYYTGALAFAEVGEHFFIYGCAESEDTPDFLLKIDQQGKTESIFELPQPLAWEMKFQKKKNQILLNLNKQFYTFSVEEEVFTPTTEQIKKISPCGKYYVEANDNKVKIFYTENDQLKGTIITEYNYTSIRNVNFSDKYLIVRDVAYSKGLKFYDLETLQLIELKDLIIPEYFTEPQGFFVSPDSRYLVQYIYTRGYLFDLQKEKFLYQFNIEHIVKTCEMQFLDAGLGVHTDNGCFSIYKIEE